MLIPESSSFKLSFIIFVIDLLEDILESSIVFLHDSVLSSQVAWEVSLKRIFERFVGKSLDGFISVVHTHQNTWGFKVVNFHTLFSRSVLWGENNLKLTGFIDDSISSSVLITESMSSDNDWFSPSSNIFLNILAENWLSENSSSKIVSDCTVWRFPHLFKIKLFNSCLVWGNGCAFNTNFASFNSGSSFESYLIVSLISVLHAQIEILDFNVQEWINKLIFDELPYDSGHLISIHINNWVVNLNPMLPQLNCSKN